MATWNSEIYKASDPEKLIVYRASSSADEIRFYFNKTGYIAATQNSKGVEIGFGDEKEEQRDVLKHIPKTRKENFKRFCNIGLLSMVTFVAFVMLAIPISLFGNSVFVGLFAFNVSGIITKIMVVVISVLQSSSFAQKSKHAAEHKMVNFLEKNRRLPRNMQELRKSSRFISKCGSARLIKDLPEEFVSKVGGLIVALLVNEVCMVLCENLRADFWISMFFYILSVAAIRWMLEKYSKLQVIVTPVKKLFTYIVQCANTTKKVDDRDIVLAYLVGCEWLQIVYPEFYKEEDNDEFMKDFFDMIARESGCKQVTIELEVF